MAVLSALAKPPPPQGLQRNVTSLNPHSIEGSRLLSVGGDEACGS